MTWGPGEKLAAELADTRADAAYARRVRRRQRQAAIDADAALLAEVLTEKALPSPRDAVVPPDGRSRLR